MKVLKLIAIIPLVLLSANTFAQSRQQGSRNERDSYGSRNSYNDRDHGRGSEGYGGRNRYRSSGRGYAGSRHSYSYVAPYGYDSRPSGLSIGLYDDYGSASYGYSDYGHGDYGDYGDSDYGSSYYPPVRYPVYRPAPVLSFRLNIGGHGEPYRRR